jgi:hypothetical protein
MSFIPVQIYKRAEKKGRLHFPGRRGMKERMKGVLNAGVGGSRFPRNSDSTRLHGITSKKTCYLFLNIFYEIVTHSWFV